MVALARPQLFGDRPPAAGADVDVLMVCTGNIARSPVAEQLLHLHCPALQCASAGTMAVVGAPMDPHSARFVAARGGHTAHRARPAIRPLLEGASLVLTMTREHRDEVLRDAPRVLHRTFTLHEFVATIDAIETPRPLAELVAHAAAHRYLGARAPDIVDPYGRSASVHDAVALEIEGAVIAVASRILPAPAR